MRLIANLFFFLSIGCFAQKNIDSLFLVLKDAKHDTLISKTEVMLARAYKSKDPEKSLAFGKKGLIHSRTLQRERDVHIAEFYIGTAFFDLAEYDSCLIYLNNCKDYFLVVENHKNYIAAMRTIATVYFFKSQFNKALDAYFSCLKSAEKIGSQSDIAKSYGNIGNIYKEEGKYDIALDYLLKALAFAENSQEDRLLFSTHINIGNVYYEMAHKGTDARKNYKQALVYYNKALPAVVKKNDLTVLAMLNCNIANVYADQKEHTVAEDLYKKALQIRHSIGDYTQISIIYDNLSSSLIEQNKLAEAKFYLDSGVVEAKKAFSYDDLSRLYNNYAEYYVRTKDFESALAYQRLHEQYKDSVFNSENIEERKELEMNFEFEKKEAQSKLEQEKKDMVLAQEKRVRTMIMWAVSVGLVLVMLFSGFIFNRYKITREQKNIIEHQKQIVDYKQKEILDSIHYANRIQKSTLTSAATFSKYLKDHFIFYKPKDIVSGDFYWAAKHENVFYLATADCTGHGVPGAMMSMLGINLLNEIISERKIISPELVLNTLRKEIIRVLNPEGSNEESQDGMDMVMLTIDLDAKKLKYAAANNSFYIIRDGALQKLSGDKMPVGKSPKDSKDFILHEVILQTNDLIVTVTDGFADQFGGPKGKKFKYKQLEEVLLSHSANPLRVQREKLESCFNSWKGNLEQVDDICVIGIKI